MIVVCAGSRTWRNKWAIEQTIRKHVHQDDIVRFGYCSTGADAYVKALTHALGIDNEAWPAAWNQHGKAAGPLRNHEMLVGPPRAELLLAWWDGVSEGTKHIIDEARKLGIRSVIVDPAGQTEEQLALWS